VRTLEGLAGLLAVLTGCSLVAVRVRRLLLPGVARSAATVADVVLVLALLLGVLHLLGAVSLLNVPSVLVAAVLLAVARRAIPEGAGAVAEPRAKRSHVLLAGTGVAVVAAQATTHVVDALRHGIHTGDSLSYHLPYALSFAQTGAILPLRFVAPQQPTPYHPQDGELLHGLGILFLGGDLLSLVLGAASLVLCLLAARAAVTSDRAPLAVLSLCVVLAVPLLSLVGGGTANTDLPALALLLCSVALLERVPTAGGLLVSGLAAGMCAGTKLTPLPALAAIGLVVLVRHRRQAWPWIAGGLATGAFWYVRTAVLTGSPLPVGFVGPDLSGLRRLDHRVVDYLGDPGLLRPALGRSLSGAWPLLLGLALLVVVVGLVRRQGLAVAAAVALIAYPFSPLSAGGPDGLPLLFGVNLRFLAPGLGLALMLLPRLVRPRVTVLAGLLLLVVVEASGGTPGLSFARTGRAFAVLVALVVLVLAVAPWTRRPLAVLAALTALLGAVPAAHQLRDVVMSDGARGPAFAWAHGISGARIGYVGFHDGYPLSGGDLSTRVSYLGRRTPHGGFDELTTCAALRTSARAVQWVVVALGFDGQPVPPQARWLRTAPGVTELVPGVFDVRRLSGGATDCPSDTVPPAGVELTSAAAASGRAARRTGT
jgi:hypothetical protein